MSYIEFTGKTVRDAIAKACEELNLEEALLEVDVLEESARGFLGLVGHRNARVRVRKRDILKEVMEVKDSETVELSTRPVVHPESEVSVLPNLKVDTDRIEALSKGPEEIDPEKSKIVNDAKALLEGILIRIPVETSVHASVTNGSVLLDITGDKSGLLIGKRGQTLDALQYIINKALNREISLEDKTEIVVDTEDYRRRKHESLRDMAVKMSLKAKKS